MEIDSAEFVPVSLVWVGSIYLWSDMDLEVDEEDRCESKRNLDKESPVSQSANSLHLLKHRGYLKA